MSHLALNFISHYLGVSVGFITNFRNYGIFDIIKYRASKFKNTLLLLSQINKCLFYLLIIR